MKKVPAWAQLAAALSGAGALLCQVLWMRSLGLFLGSDSQAGALALMAVMGGLGLGALALPRLRLQPLPRTYALLECGVAVLACASFLVLSFLPPFYASLAAAHAASPAWGPGLKGLFSAVCILPASLLSGLTLPLLLHSLGASPNPDSSTFPGVFSRLYRANTLGAAAGALSPLLLLPILGLPWTLALALLCHLGAAALTFKRPAAPALQPQAADPNPASPTPLLNTVALGTGAAAFILELLWMRTLSLVLGSSVYAFGFMLFALLLGLALGAAAFGRWNDRLADVRRALGLGLAALGILTLLQWTALGQLPASYFFLAQRLPANFASQQALAFGLAFLALLPLSLAQGFVFPLLSRWPGASVSRLFGWNALGALLGAGLAGFVLIPRLGLQAPFVVAAAIPLLLFPWLWNATGPKRLLLTASLALALLAALRYYRPWDPQAMSSGVYLYGLRDLEKYPQGVRFEDWLKTQGQLLYYQEGREALLSVRGFGPGRLSLQLNGKSDASTADAATFKLNAQIPLALHPAPKTALVIGWGSGCSVASALLQPLEHLDCVEIEPATTAPAVLELFHAMNQGRRSDPRLRLWSGDGRNFMLTGSSRYDVIISEPSSPWIMGMAGLFTLENYRLAAARLAKGGLYCQWFHYDKMGLEDLRTQVRTFLAAFSYVSLWTVPENRELQARPCDLFLVGSSEAQHLDASRVAGLFSDSAIGGDLRLAGLADADDFFMGYLAGQGELSAFAGSGPLNRDLWPSLEFSAPRFLSMDKKAQQALGQDNFQRLESAALSLPPVEGDGRYQAAGPATARAKFLADLGSRALRRGFNGRGKALLGAAVQLDPRLREAWLSLGKCHYSLGDFEAARQTFEQMADHLPKDGEAYLGQALALLKLGRATEAGPLLERCLRLDPGNRLAKGMLEWLRQAR